MSSWIPVGFITAEPRQELSVLTISIRNCTRGSSQCNKSKKKKEFKGVHIEKKEGEKTVLFADIIIIFVDNPWTLKK